MFNRFTGPGRVCLQSAYFHPPVQEGAGRRRPARGWRRPGRRSRPRRARRLMAFAPGTSLEPPAAARDRRLARPRRAINSWSRSRASGRAASGPRSSCWWRRTPIPALPDAGTQISLHHGRVKDEAEVSGFVGLAAQLGYLRLSGYRLALERSGLRSKVNVVNPATGAVVATIPDRQAGKLFGGGVNASRLLASVRALPPAGPPPDTQNPELMREVLLALALRRRQPQRGGGGRAGRPGAGCGARESAARSAGGAGGGETGRLRSCLRLGRGAPAACPVG